MVDLMKWAETKIEKFAELMVVNGGQTAINQVGKISKDSNKYGRRGLNMNEALELSNLTGQLAILYENYKDQIPHFNELLKSEITGSSVIMISKTDLEKLFSIKF